MERRGEAVMPQWIVPLSRPVIEEEEEEAVRDCISRNHLSTGEEVEAFEEALANAVGTDHAVAVNSGSSALLLIWTALKELYGKKMPTIKTPVVSWATTITPLIQLHIPIYWVHWGHPVNYPVHVMGFQYPNYDKCLVEDSCEFLGADYEPISDIQAHSFFASHIITTMGQGGAITTFSTRIRNMCHSLRNFGRKIGGRPYEFIRPGYNMRMTDPQAAMGLAQLKKLKRFVERKRSIARKIQGIKNESWLEWNYYDRKAAYFAYPIIFNTLAERLKADNYFTSRKIETRPLLAFHPAQPYINWDKKGWIKKMLSFKNEYNVWQRIICLPCHQGLTDEEVNYLCKCLKEYPQ